MLAAQANVDSDNGSYGEAETHNVKCICISEQEDSIDMLPAEIEDLGKRNRTNLARDSIVKKLRETPPNADTSMGGYK